MDSIEGSNMRIVEIQKVLIEIKTERWKEQVEGIQYHISNGDTKEADNAKRKLSAFTISATFKEKRNKESVYSYSGLLHLDYDKLDNVQELKAKVINMPLTYSAFISPSGRGLKVLVKSNNDLSTHTFAFNALRDYYDGIVGVSSDKSVKDVTRLCFVSYDSDLYLNEDAEVFKSQSYPNNETASQKNIALVWDYTSNKQDFIVGNRNNFTHSYACNANRQGYNINEALNHAYSYSDSTFDKEEIERTVKSAYENNKSENTSTAILPIAISKEESSPYISESVYNALPLMLKEASSVFKGRERDVFLTSALSAVSGGLHNVYGLYADDKVYPNLFSFVIAPPASGKGSMKYAKQLGECYHDFLFNKSKEALKEYKRAKKIFDIKLKKAKTDQAIEALIEPEEPKATFFFIPGDTSSAMIIKLLEANNGAGCICETEADTITKTFNQDWGGYSDVLRKGFHAEPITKSRLTNLEYSEIKEPKFSLTMTGTPNQMNSLVTSVEDGLFSRIMFYSYISEPVWKNTYTSNLSKSKKVMFEKYSADLCEKFKSDVPRKFTMTEEQGAKLDNFFSDAHAHNIALYSQSASGITFRLGLMCFKIAMVLSAVRSDDTEMICSDEDFNTAFKLVGEVYMPHAMTMLNKVGKQAIASTPAQTELLTWIRTKEKFSRAEALIKAKEINVKDRTLTDILKRFVESKLIKKISHGVYTNT